MLSDCRISGFADEINKDFDIQLSVLKELGQEYVELRSADGTGVADLSLEMASERGERMRAAGIRVSSVDHRSERLRLPMTLNRISRHTGMLWNWQSCGSTVYPHVQLLHTGRGRSCAV